MLASVTGSFPLPILCKLQRFGHCWKHRWNRVSVVTCRKVSYCSEFGEYPGEETLADAVSFSKKRRNYKDQTWRTRNVGGHKSVYMQLKFDALTSLVP